MTLIFIIVEYDFKLKFKDSEFKLRKGDIAFLKFNKPSESPDTSQNVNCVAGELLPQNKDFTPGKSVTAVVNVVDSIDKVICIGFKWKPPQSFSLKNNNSGSIVLNHLTFTPKDNAFGPCKSFCHSGDVEAFEEVILKPCVVFPV